MVTPFEVHTEAFRIRDLFLAAGAQPVETDVLQRADVLLDLYGEDIRGRAYVVQDPAAGEMMLRPDFTVPVVQMHMADRAEPARYAYYGKIFRKQEDDPNRPREYSQVGYELFDRENPAGADAEVFALVGRALDGLACRAVMGDIGIIKAAVAGLNTTERRKAALMRHIWRPDRFRVLLDRFGGRTKTDPVRQEMIESKIGHDGPLVGLRTRAEVQERLAALKEDAQQPPISAEEMKILDQLLSLKTDAISAVDALDGLAQKMPSIADAVATTAARHDAMLKDGIDVAAAQFEVTYGRSSMEYYDGFVFGMYAQGTEVPVATGGRYDALTRQLGGGSEIPAVGAVIRPSLSAQLRGSTS